MLLSESSRLLPGASGMSSVCASSSLHEAGRTAARRRIQAALRIGAGQHHEGRQRDEASAMPVQRVELLAQRAFGRRGVQRAQAAADRRSSGSPRQALDPLSLIVARGAVRHRGRRGPSAVLAFPDGRRATQLLDRRARRHGGAAPGAAHGAWPGCASLSAELPGLAARCKARRAAPCRRVAGRQRAAGHRHRRGAAAAGHAGRRRHRHGRRWSCAASTRGHAPHRRGGAQPLQPTPPSARRRRRLAALGPLWQDVGRRRHAAARPCRVPRPHAGRALARAAAPAARCACTSCSRSSARWA